MNSENSIISYQIKEKRNDKYDDNNNNNNNNNNKIDDNIIDILNNDSFFSDLDIEHCFDNDNLLAQQIDYNENYNLKMLHHICNYYQIPKRKSNKEQIISKIIEFESNSENLEKVTSCKRLWYFLNELQNDSYFSKFILFNK